MIYLDYAATTPIDKRVFEVMMPYFSDSFGNPSSVHRYGQTAEAVIDSAHEIISTVLKCQPNEIIFTSGGSESDNLALRGVSLAVREKSGANQILASKAEHPAVSKTAEFLEKYYGFHVVWLDADKNGAIKPEVVEKAITKNTAIVTVMYANNEIGTINNIREIAEICHQHKVLFHSDAVQAAAYLPLDVIELGIDLMSLGAHKFYGPKGIGALYIKKGTPILPMQTGGSQERGLRAGTQNVPYIVGFAEALRLTDLERGERTAHVKPLRDRLIGSILESIPDSHLTGELEPRLPNHASFVFKGVDGNLLLAMLDSSGYACSSGSACKTGNPEPSEVMSAIGLSPEWGLGSLRLTLGAESKVDHIESLLSSLPDLIAKTRSLARN
jgi:cysteine desulfurase